MLGNSIFPTSLEYKANDNPAHGKGLELELDDLSGYFQPKVFYGSVNVFHYIWLMSTTDILLILLVEDITLF